MGMKVYLVGRMSGLPEGNFPAFRRAAAHLREKGHEVVSPVELNEADGLATAADPGHPRRAEFLARDVAIVADPTTEALVVLAGWEKSEGAQLEVYVARALKKPVLNFPGLNPMLTRASVERVLGHVTETVLEEAERLVSGARADTYGHPAVHSAKVAGLWRAAFGWDVDAFRVNLAMVLFKTARAAAGTSRDSLVDIGGYARAAEAVLARRGTEGFTDLRN